MEKRMNILLTGGSGFLGRHIVESAKSKKYSVLSPSSKNCNLLDLNHASNYLSSVGNIDVIIHSAAYYGGIGINQAEPAKIFSINTSMAINIFELAKIYKIKKVVVVGSACAYPGYLDGDLQEVNFWNGPLHDSVEAYGFSKKTQLVAQKAYFKQYGIESNHLILTNLYGPHDVFTEYRSHVVSALIKKFTDAKENVVLWGNGSPIREFLYVEDAADIITKVIDVKHSLDPVNIGTGVGTSIKQLADLVGDYTNFKGKIEWDTTKPNGTARKVLDVSKMREQLNWYPQWSLQDGLRKTIQWYLDNKEIADKRS